MISTRTAKSNARCIMFIACLALSQVVTSFSLPHPVRSQSLPINNKRKPHLSIRGGTSELQSVPVLSALDTFWKTNPFAAAGIICGMKASAADWVAQQRQFLKSKDTSGSDAIENIPEKTKTPSAAPAKIFDMQRNFVYLLYGAIYQGVAQEFVYNHIYPVMFGNGVDVRTVLSKVAFDLIIQTTLVTLPIAYLSKAMIYRYSFKEAARRYIDDIKNHGLWTKYFALWGPVQCLTFSVVPVHLRVTFIAVVSFFWLIVLSSIASKGNDT